MSHFGTYIQSVGELFESGSAREHAYRPAFQLLIRQLQPDIQVINEPAYTDGNAPDFLFKKGDVPVAYAECKDIGVDLTDKAVQKQARRYVEAFGKILLTNYLDFQIIDEGGVVATFSVAEVREGTVLATAETFEYAENLIKGYLAASPRSIRSAKRLAEIMASKARMLRDSALASLKENPTSDIGQQYDAFQQVLIHDLSQQDFADMYAQTLVYGLFVARYYDSTIQTFSRHEAHDLLPSTNPLLKKFFGHVAGTEYDEKIAWLVDSLIDTYLAADVASLMHREFEKKSKDPVLHFYETFLTEYDKGLRKSRGVYYTPQSVVSFMVRSVDEILRQKFGLKDGLADAATIEYKEKVQATDGRTRDGVKQITTHISRVQILDPAVGTGTFLNEVVCEVYKKFKGQEGIWPSYVQESLLPRLHGFELMMASYTMAHLKLGVTLAEMGYTGAERLSIWLTNSLERGVREIPNLFMNRWLTEESNQASRIKSDLPVMVVIGNPPYSGVSSNDGEYATQLADKYKIEPGGHQKLQERKHWLNDDYVKFISLAEDQINSLGEGVVALITPHGYLDNPTFRGMRWHLMQSFDEIYVLDLHGNSNKKETTRDGGKDENVFNIKTGVSILFGIKNGLGSGEAQVYRSDLLGTRSAKFEMLDTASWSGINWQELSLRGDNYYFKEFDDSANDAYRKGIDVSKLMPVNTSGIVTMGDEFAIADSREGILNRLMEVIESDVSESVFKERFSLGKNYAGWMLGNKGQMQIDQSKLAPIAYRPFDLRWTYFDNKVIWRSRENVMKHFLAGDNVGLLLTKGVRDREYRHVFVTRAISEAIYLSSTTATNAMNLPLYLYEGDGKIPNLDKKIWQEINDVVGETEPEDVLDYVYARLHSPSYREKYKELLKIDFPRVPYPESKNEFWRFVGLGKELRQLHLLEHPKASDFITTYPVVGSNKVTRKLTKTSIGFELTNREVGTGRVWINDEQYFDGVPQVAWDFYIGGYQPAQKWLKDRYDRMLSAEDIRHYQHMIVALVETERIMKEIG